MLIANTLVLLMLVLFILGSTGVGIEINKKLKINKDFAMPIGLAAILFIAQLCYYPIQYFNLSFKLLAIVSLILLVLVAIITLKNIKDIIFNFKNHYLLFALMSFILYLFVFYHCFIDLDYSDSVMYLNYAAQNVNIDKLNMFNLYTGKYGAEWDGLYLYQGYYHLMSFCCWLLNLPKQLGIISTSVDYIQISTWLFGMLYSLTSSLFICNFFKEMKIENKVVNYSLLLFTLLFSNFYYWRVVFAYYGNTYRTLFTAMLVYYLHQWIKGNKNYYYYIPIIIGASLACSSSSLITVFATMVCLMAYLFIAKKENAFHDLAFFVFPLVIYACVMISKQKLIVGILIAICALVYYLTVNNKINKMIVNSISKVLYDHGKLIFYIIVPVVVMVISFIINKFDSNFLIDYHYAFQNHQNYDMVKDYSFRYSNIIDNILNVIRYLGVALIILKAKSDEDNFIKVLIIIMLLVFVNPFSATTIAYFIASNVYYRSIEVLFNPFIELLIVLFIINNGNKKLFAYGVSISLLVITLLGHVLSFNNNENGLYTFYVEGGKEVDGIKKLEDDELEAIGYLQEYVSNNVTEGQPVIISHSSGIRTYIPNAYVLFTPRDQFYPHTRLNEEFYQIAKRHRDWEDNDNINYQKACSYLKDYNVDYLLIRYWENEEFDKATDECSSTYVTTSKFKVKIVDKE